MRIRVRGAQSPIRPVPHVRRWVRLGNFSQPLRAGLTCVAPTALGKTNAVGWTPVARGRIGHPPGREQDKAKSRSLTAVQELRFLGFRIARSF